MTIGERIKNIMDRNQMTAYSLAKLIKKDKGTISNYINNRTKPNADFLEPFAELYNLNIQWLVTGEGPILTEKGYQIIEEQQLALEPRENFFTHNPKEMMDTIKNLNTLITMQQEQINRLYDYINELETELGKKKRIS